MRGYDPEEVDEYVEALRDSEEEQARAAQDLEVSNRDLNAEIEKLRRRTEELESRLRAESPRSIAALGERLTLILQEAEDSAAETLSAAHAEADGLLAAARSAADEQRRAATAFSTDAEHRATGRLAAAEERATAMEDAARVRAEKIVADAEQRALARRGEIEEWVERVRAHIESEEARAAEEFARVRALRSAELADLDKRRETLINSLLEVGDALRRTVESARAAVVVDHPHPVLSPAGSPDEGGRPRLPEAARHETEDGDASVAEVAADDEDGSTEAAAGDRPAEDRVEESDPVTEEVPVVMFPTAAATPSEVAARAN